MSADGEGRLEVLIIGAGFAGICAAIKLREAGVTSLRIVDKNPDIGGTWFANTYPGATCDVPSHFYSLSFAPNPNWSRLYSPQKEILAYLRDCVETFGIAPILDLGHEVRSLTYDAERRGWRAEIDGRGPVFARFVINGTGGLHRPILPEIEGRDSFGGATMHTALWDHAFDATGKRVAVIGTAASAIQVIPQMAKRAARVDVYQRTANYISPRGNFVYSKEQKARFARFPAWQRLYRRIIRTRMDWLLFPLILREKRRSLLSDRILRYLGKAVPDPELRAKLTPEFELGCKRILVSDDFYPSLNRENVDLITEPIRRITGTGIETRDGVLREVDAIIYATGFDMYAHMKALPVTGRDGVRLGELWGERIEAYRTVMVAGFPNYFTVTGPNSGTGTTSVVDMIEQAVGWIVKAIRATPAQGSVDVKPEAQAAWNKALHAKLDKTVWATGCSSWYKRADGRIETLYPGSAAAYAREMRRLRRGELVFEE